MPTKQDFQVLKENEERLRKCLYIAITTIFILVGGILIKTINTCQMTTTTCKEASINHNGMSDKYILGTLGDTWLHNHTDLLLMSEGEGWTFLYHPLEFNMSTFVGYNNYVIRESPAQRLQKDNVLEGVNLISSTKLTVFVHYGRQSDATFSIPTDKCSDQYIIPMHTFCKNSKGKIRVFAPHNAADITIKLVTSGSVKFKGNMYNPGDEISIRVRRNQILTIDHDVSLAGTAILSSTPVCVLAGIEWKGNGNTYKPVVSTVLPSMHLSRSYIVPNVVGKWSKVQLISTADNNNVVIDSYYDERDQQILKTSESYEKVLVGRQPIIITGSQDFVVTVLVSHTTVDPFLLWIVGIDQYKSLYRFYIPWYDNTFIHEIYVICKSRYRNDLRLNDALVYPISDSTVVFDVGDEGYEGFRVKVQCCKNYVIEHKFGKTLGLYVYGYPGDVKSHFRSYGYPAGISLR
ncbi:uncharacterized protein [Argopecten irradians]